MRRAKNGFTIVEVMIYLAVSGVMFLIAFFGMRGQQDSVGFRQSLNSIELKIRGIFNNVDNGYFGNVGQLRCDAPASNNYQITISPVAREGGSNGDCVFIGKTVDFNNDPSKMSIATLIGSRLAQNLTYNTTLIEVSQLAETYTIDNSVKWSGSYLYNADTNPPVIVAVNNLRVSAQRDRNDDSGNAQANLRAQRKYNIDKSETWPSIDSKDMPMFCFVLGNRKGSIIITQEDITVDYNGVGCPNPQ